jgi:toxin ParE1/3/4
LASVRRTATSRRDLIEIWKYVAADNEHAADGLLDHIEAVLGLLAKSPLLGRSREELAPDMRSFPVGNYVIFYIPRKDGITVVRVLSAFRNLDTLFRE